MDLTKIRIQALEDSYFYRTRKPRLDPFRHLSELERFYLRHAQSLANTERFLRDVQMKRKDRRDVPQPTDRMMEDRRAEELMVSDYQEQLRDQQMAEQSYRRDEAMMERALEADLHRFGY